MYSSQPVVAAFTSEETIDKAIKTPDPAPTSTRATRATVDVCDNINGSDHCTTRDYDRQRYGNNYDNDDYYASSISRLVDGYPKRFWSLHYAAETNANTLTSLSCSAAARATTTTTTAAARHETGPTNQLDLDLCGLSVNFAVTGDRESQIFEKSTDSDDRFSNCAITQMAFAFGAANKLVKMASYLFIVITFCLMISLFPLMESASPFAITSISSNQVQGDAEDTMDSLSDNSKIKIQTPVIGVLTQVLRDYKRFTKDKHLHLAASYVKWIESAGAQAIPILLNQDDAYYEMIFKQTNGLLFPGGDNLLDPHKATPMMVAARKLYRLAVEANDRGDHYPIWGTCLGMELLSVLTANRNVLAECSAVDMALKMNFTSRGKLFAPSSYAGLDMGHDYSGAVVDMMSNKNVTYNYHHKCLTDEGMAEAKLDSFYRPLSYSRDKNGLEFIAIFEAIKYPFFGVQFHPEKAPFEMVRKKHQWHIPHTREAIAVSRYFGDFFIQQAQMSGHQPGPKSELEKLFIYSHEPTYTAPLNDMYEQRYLFPFTSTDGVTEEEFIHYVPSEDEEAPEEVTVEVKRLVEFFDGNELNARFESRKLAAPEWQGGKFRLRSNFYKV